jgi:hypothetical protein
METEGNNIKGLNVEELASLARRYYAARFPNPQRLGCPPPSEIKKVVRGAKAPDEALREHLFECSECFGEYRQALAQRGPAPAEVAWREWMISVIASRSLALALAPVILILSSFFFYRLVLLKPASEAGQITQSAPSDNRAGGGGEAATSQVAAVAVATIPKSTVNSRSMVGAWKSSGISRPGAETIDVDLDNYQVFRRSQREGLTSASEGASGTGGAKSSGDPDEATSGEKVISLPATRANLLLQLPETGAPGKYNVSLINAFGRPLLSNTAFSPDGAKLRVTLDLRRVPPKKYRLRLWRNGEAPAFYDVVIGAR